MKYTIYKNKRPAYLQIYKQLRDDIVSGIYGYGAKLPSKRLLAEESGVSTITIEHAYACLCDEGYAASRERSGYYVIFKSSDGFAVTDSVNTQNILHENETNEEAVFPISVLSRTMRRVLSDYHDVLLERSPNTGRIELRTAIRRYLAGNRGIYADINQIVIGSGAEYLYGLIVDLLGRDKMFAIEKPSYQKIKQVYQAEDIDFEMLPLTNDGIDSLALASTRASVLHTTPYRSYPSLCTASATKRHEYIRWAEQSGRFIIEDDFESEFSVSSKPTETLFALSEGNNVIYLNTFSKTISPSLRVGYMVIPDSLLETFEEKLGFYSCTVPTFEQFVLTELINSGDFERHINRVRRSKRKNMQNNKQII